MSYWTGIIWISIGALAAAVLCSIIDHRQNKNAAKPHDPRTWSDEDHNP